MGKVEFFFLQQYIFLLSECTRDDRDREITWKICRQCGSDMWESSLHFHCDISWFQNVATAHTSHFCDNNKYVRAFTVLGFAFRNLEPCATPFIRFGASNQKDGMRSEEVH